MKVSIEFAKLFKDQCIGTTNGHMAEIANNALFQSMFMAMTGEQKLSDFEFAETLEAIATALRNQETILGEFK
jgi:hypothetical protein